MTACERMLPFLRSADFAELDEISNLVYERTAKLFAPQVRFQQLCAERGWWHTFYSHPGIPGAVFLCVKTANRQYREFLGYNKDLRVARILASAKALRYYNVIPSSKNRRGELTMAKRQCLDVELDAIQAGISAYRQAVRNGTSESTAQDAATVAETRVILQNVEQLVKYEKLLETYNNRPL